MPRSRILLLACCLFALVVGARWAWYNQYGSDLPEADQWDGEGQAILYPWSTGKLRPSDFFLPHNEHRIVFTRLLAFGLTAANGQWDQRLEAVCNALLAAAIVVAFWLLAARRLTFGWQVGLFLGLTAAYLLPVASQNLVLGFASAQYFLIWLAMGSIVILPFAEPYRLRWWAGCACVLLSVGSMGSGFFAAVVVAVMLAAQVGRGVRTFHSALPSLVVCLAATAAGVMTRTVVPAHEVLKAHSVGEFLATTAKALGWPAFDFNWGPLALVLFAPWALVTLRLVASQERRAPPRPWDELLSGLGLWVVFQVLASAYARGADSPSPASRYVDTLLVGSVVNLLCLNSLWQNLQLPKPRREVLAIFIGGWAFLFAIGLAGEASQGITAELLPLRNYHARSQDHVRNYLITGDEAYLLHPEIPYPVEWALKHDLSLPGLVDRLPVSVRKPLPLAPASGPTLAGFRRCDSRVPERQLGTPQAGAGLAPQIPALTNAITWGSYGAAEAARWSSQPFRLNRATWLRFPVAGDLERTGSLLQLKDAASHEVAVPILPRQRPGPGWQSVWVRAPAGTFTLAAQSERGSGWFAFGEPTEMGIGSYWAWQATRSGSLLAALAAVFACGLFAAPRKSA